MVIGKKLFIGSVIFLYSLANLSAQSALSQIESLEQFKQLSSTPLNKNLTGFESVKLVFDLEQDKLYFIHSRRYAFHYPFCSERLFYPGNLYEFNRDNYSEHANRSYILGNLNWNAKDSSFFIDFSVFDQSNAQTIRKLHKEVAKAIKLPYPVLLLANTQSILQQSDQLEGIPLVYPNTLLPSKDFQLLGSGKTIGKLVIVDHPDSLHQLLFPNEILAFRTTPDFVPKAQGILLGEFQTPLSHFSILSANRNIPIAADQRLFSDSNFIALNGQWIELRIDDTGIQYAPSKQHYLLSESKAEKHLTVDYRENKLVPLSAFKQAGVPVIGSKAFNLGQLTLLQKKGEFRTPEGIFAIPVFFYRQHLIASGASELIPQLEKTKDLDSIRHLLKEIRERIRNFPVNEKLVGQIQENLEEYPEFRTFRFRSSSNAEDLPFFSGAGLYTSTTVDLDNPNKSIERALRKVWASLWSFDAYAERAAYTIASEEVAMAVLVHRSFPNEVANGVIVTRNIHKAIENEGLTINVQTGDVSVVDAPDSISCEQIAIVNEMTYSAFNESVEYVRFSSLNDYKPILSTEDLQKIQRAVAVIKRDFWNREPMRVRMKGYENYGLDLEFKLVGAARILYIKQVRPYLR